MCGRFTYLYTWRELHRLLGLTRETEPPDWRPSFNVAPTQTVPVVRQDSAGERTVTMLRWGLVPFWADEPSIGSRLINARSEEAATKPSFRAAWKKRRCLVPISGFYEWQVVQGSKTKQPWYFTVKDVPLFAVAGLWESWDKAGEPLETFTILTGKPNELVAAVHDRMPCIVSPEDYDRWLDPSIQTMEELGSALVPFSAQKMEALKVSTRVNSPKNNDASLIAPCP